MKSFTIITLFLLLVGSVLAQDDSAEFTGNVTVGGNFTVNGSSSTVGGVEVCLADGTNCPAAVVDTFWNINGSVYLFNNTGVLDVNSSVLNATIDNRIVTTSASLWELSVALAIFFTIGVTTYNFTLLDGGKSENRQ